jgi:hypothetical protein
MVQCIVNLGNYLKGYETMLLSNMIFLMYACALWNEDNNEATGILSL